MKYPITRIIRYLKRTKDDRKKRTRALFYKLVFLMIEIHGLFLVTVSYFLAWNERTNVLESLSETVIKEIVTPFIAYTISRTVENIAEKNVTSIHVPLGEQTNELIKESEGDG